MSYGSLIGWLAIRSQVEAADQASRPVMSLAGQKISAYARANIWSVESGKKNVKYYVLAGMLIAFG